MSIIRTTRVIRFDTGWMLSRSNDDVYRLWCEDKDPPALVPPGSTAYRLVQCEVAAPDTALLIQRNAEYKPSQE